MERQKRREIQTNSKKLDLKINWAKLFQNLFENHIAHGRDSDDKMFFFFHTNLMGTVFRYPDVHLKISQCFSCNVLSNYLIVILQSLNFGIPMESHYGIKNCMAFF